MFVSFSSEAGLAVRKAYAIDFCEEWGWGDRGGTANDGNVQSGSMLLQGALLMVASVG